jgi:hypothetical protein
MKALFPACCALLIAWPCGAADDASVVVTAIRDPVDKSYRRMVSGIELFEKRRELAPAAELRFKLLPRQRGTRMDEIEVAVVSDSFETPVEVAPDRTFTLGRDPRALKEDASVRPNRKRMTMTWRADIRTPGLPPDARRLGDLRLECEVGIQAGLTSNLRPGLLNWLRVLVSEGPEYCRSPEPRYLFFAERAIFGVTMMHGARREVIPVDRLWAGAVPDPDWKKDMQYCDCEVLVDRAYFLPLGDTSWPDDTLIRFEYMDAPP